MSFVFDPESPRVHCDPYATYGGRRDERPVDRIPHRLGPPPAGVETHVALEELLDRYLRHALPPPGWARSRWARSHPKIQVQLAA